MKINVYANVIEDWKGRIQMPYGMANFRTYISRNFITSDSTYMHPNWRANVGDLIIWAFKDENDVWYLLGDGFVRSKWKNELENCWEFHIESARLYPRSIKLDDLSFSAKKKALHVGFSLTWKQYRELIEKIGEPLV